MELYIHIPFCKKFCAYCDFVKCIYNKQTADQYRKIRNTYRFILGNLSENTNLFESTKDKYLFALKVIYGKNIHKEAWHKNQIYAYLLLHPLSLRQLQDLAWFHIHRYRQGYPEDPDVRSLFQT